MNIRYVNSYKEFISDIKTSILISIDTNPDFINIIEYISNKIFEDANIITHINNLKNYDNYTYKHSLNVAAISLFLGYKKEYSIESLYAITVGALLHDIGKTKTPLSILNKSSNLSKEEFEVIKLHSSLGYQLIKKESIPKVSKEIVLYHHSCSNNSGYPFKPRNYKIPEEVHLVSTCDIFDALISKRPYKIGMSKIDAFNLIKNELTNSSNLAILTSLSEYISIFEIGDIVQLNTNDMCEIIAINSTNLQRPIVRILNENESNSEIINLNKNRTYSII